MYFRAERVAKMPSIEFIHVPTLFFIAGILTVLYVLLQPVVLMVNPGIPGLRPWAIGNLLTGSGILLILGRLVLPAFITIVMANIFIIAGHFVIYAGLRIHNGKGAPQVIPIASVIAVFSLQVVYFTYVDQDIFARTVVYCLVAAGINFLTAYEASLGFRSRSLVRWSFAALMVLHGLYSLLRLYFLARLPAGGDLMQEAIYIKVSILEVTVYLYVISIAYILMLTQYLSDKNKSLAEKDPLTGVFNRRIFSVMAEAERNRALRGKNAFSLLSLDIDHFKDTNDSMGHAAGDAALKAFAESLKSSLRSSDIIGRIGGDEFVILLPDTDVKEASLVAGKIRMSIQDLKIAFEGKPIPLRLSIGISWNEKKDKTVDEILREADIALYEAKRGGRNRFEIYRRVQASQPALDQLV